MINNNSAYARGSNFEMFIGRVFNSFGYSVGSFPERENKGIPQRYDMMVNFKSNSESAPYIVEIKYYRSERFPYSTLKKIAYQLDNAIDVLNSDVTSGIKPQKLAVISSYVDEKVKAQMMQDTGMHILDISNLLYIVSANEKLSAELQQFIEYSTSDIIPQKPSIDGYVSDGKLKKDAFKIEKTFIDALQAITPGKQYATKYEKYCFDLLKYLFKDDLLEWNKQTNSNDGLYRFDCICKIKSGPVSDFFDTIRSYFNTKYLVFEFKNYTDPITQQEIYTTEKYLYSKALRGVAIIVTRTGVDNNGWKALKGSLRENGKLILPLEDADLIKMLEMKGNNDVPADYLSKLLDRMLIELEK